MFDRNQTIILNDIPLDTIKSLVVERSNFSNQLYVLQPVMIILVY